MQGLGCAQLLQGAPPPADVIGLWGHPRIPLCIRVRGYVGLGHCSHIYRARCLVLLCSPETEPYL